MNAKLNGKAYESECVMTRNEVKYLYDFCRQALNMPGYSKDFSLLLLDNHQTLAYMNDVIDNGMPNALSESRYKECEEEFKKILEQFGDRDSQGNLVHDEEGNIIINDQRIEFDEARDKLYEKYADVKASVEGSSKLAEKYMQEPVKVMLVLLNKFEDYPDTLPPNILRMFECYY